MFMMTPSKKKIIESFRRSIESYDTDASVQGMVGQELIRALQNYPDLKFRRVLEVGCCTGGMTELLCTRYPVGELWLSDIVAECCRTAAERVHNLPAAIHQLAGDVEARNLPSRLDLVLSSSTLQWMRDLPALLAKFHRSLTGDGFLAFTLFGPGTMEQIRALTGIGLDYTSEGSLLSELQQRYTVLDCSTTTHTLFFPSGRAVLRHIRQTGVGGVADYQWTKGNLHRFEEEYRVRFQTAQGLPLDYVSTCIIARRKGGV